MIVDLNKIRKQENNEWISYTIELLDDIPYVKKGKIFKLDFNPFFTYNWIYHISNGSEISDKAHKSIDSVLFDKNIIKVCTEDRDTLGCPKCKGVNGTISFSDEHVEWHDEEDGYYKDIDIFFTCGKCGKRYKITTTSVFYKW